MERKETFILMVANFIKSSETPLNCWGELMTDNRELAEETLTESKERWLRVMREDYSEDKYEVAEVTEKGQEWRISVTSRATNDVVEIAKGYIDTFV